MLKYKVCMISLGCDKNLVDSEKMLGILNDKYSITEDLCAADIIIVNTCGFIESAKQESINAILEVADYKDAGSCKALIVTGCLAQRYKDHIMKETPQVDAVVGTGSYGEIQDVVERCIKGNRVETYSDINALCEIEKRVLTTPKHTAFLTIAQGCDNFCTYCVIPKIRGKYRSRKAESILAEAKDLVSKGVKELIIIAQDTTKYGTDLYNKPMLSELLDSLCLIDELKWIRLMYCYPEGMDDKLINTIKNQDKICKYLDIPIQHSNNEILKLMGRRSTRENLIGLLNKLRNEIPEITIRTSIIVGFPGESQKHFDDLVEFIKVSKFDRLGAFIYSREEGTPAYKLKNQVPLKIKEKRLDILMKVQQEISFDKNKELEGKVIEVLTEGLYENNIYYGRTYKDAPEVDGIAYFYADENVSPGSFVKIRINRADEYDLNGEII